MQANKCHSSDMRIAGTSPDARPARPQEAVVEIVRRFTVATASYGIRSSAVPMLGPIRRAVSSSFRQA